MLRSDQYDIRRRGAALSGIEKRARIYSAKITIDDVHEIRRLYLLVDARGRRIWPQAKLGAKYGLTQPAISYILRRKRWRDVEETNT